MELEKVLSLVAVGMYGYLALIGLTMFVKRKELIEKHAEKLRKWKEKERIMEERIQNLQAQVDGNLAVVGATQHGKVTVNQKTINRFREFKEKWEKFEKEANSFKWKSLIKASIGTAIGFISVYLSCWAFGFCQIPKAYETKLFGWLLLGLIIFPGILLALIFSFEEIPSPGEFKVGTGVDEGTVSSSSNKEDEDEDSGLSLAAAGAEPYQTYYFGYDTSVPGTEWDHWRD